MSVSPEILASRVINQYRKRDVISYLGLRLYLGNKCAVRDRWAINVACLLTQNSTRPKYHESLHFKGRDEDTNKLEYRRLCLPTPNEILAEAVLINECAKIGGSFATSPSVYSYLATKGTDRRGIFVPYFSGFKRRHKGIRKAAESIPNGVVLYTDIRKFYPSIEHKTALDAWRIAARDNGLASDLTELGIKLLEGYKTSCLEYEKGILTGPMFAHFIANLIFKPIDEDLSDFLPNGYFRYVDDIAFVGTQEEVLQAEKKLEQHLDRLCGLESHPKKRIEIPASEWLKGANDFDDEEETISWKSFIGKMKQLLITKPDLTNEITQKLTSSGFRIRPVDYSDAVQDASYLERLKVLGREAWFRKTIRRATPETLLREAQVLRTRYAREFWDWVDAPVSNEYDKKRRIHGLRRYASKLIYLADPRDLKVIVEALRETPELELYTVIFDALDTGDVSALVNYGASAAQSAATPLLAAHQHVVCKTEHESVAVHQAKSVLFAYGVSISETTTEELFGNEMLQFCKWEHPEFYINRAKRDSFFDELAGLHGFNSPCQHQAILSTAFDLREDIISDISELLGNSPS